MIYFYACDKCGDTIEDEASVNSFKDHHPVCEECGGIRNYVWVPTIPQVAFKDGPSGSWPSKGERFKKYRAKASASAEKRQTERYNTRNHEMVPNYKGKETSDWSSAMKMARDDKGHSAAASYIPKVLAEDAKKV